MNKNCKYVLDEIDETYIKLWLNLWPLSKRNFFFMFLKHVICALSKEKKMAHLILACLNMRAFCFRVSANFWINNPKKKRKIKMKRMFHIKLQCYLLQVEQVFKKSGKYSHHCYNYHQFPTINISFNRLVQANIIFFLTYD